MLFERNRLQQFAPTEPRFEDTKGEFADTEFPDIPPEPPQPAEVHGPPNPPILKAEDVVYAAPLMRSQEGVIESVASSPVSPEEKTRSENQQALEDAITQYRKQIGEYVSTRRGEPEKPKPPEGRLEKLSRYVRGRSSDLSESSKTLGKWVESAVHTVSEKYQHLGWKKQVALGATLGLGTAAFAGVATPLAALFGTGVAVQRVLGGIGMYVKFEKHLASKGTGPLGLGDKAAAAFAAAAYTLGTGALASGAIHALSESPLGEMAQEFLKHHWPFESGGGVPAPSEVPLAPEAGHAPPASEVPEGPLSADGRMPDASDTPVSETAPAQSAPGETMPQTDYVESPQQPPHPRIDPSQVSIEAAKGKGYEWMMKRMWENTTFQKLDPHAFAEGSDIRKLLDAHPDSIDKVVHEIAIKQGFFGPDGSSVSIDGTTRMTFGTDGQVHLSDARHSDITRALPRMGK